KVSRPAAAARSAVDSRPAAGPAVPSIPHVLSVLPGFRSGPCWDASAGRSVLAYRPPESDSPGGRRSVHLPRPNASVKNGTAHSAVRLGNCSAADELNVRL